jgi:hypothetical protein
MQIRARRFGVVGADAFERFARISGTAMRRCDAA